jgi:hypothetical protein
MIFLITPAKFDGFPKSYQRVPRGRPEQGKKDRALERHPDQRAVIRDS